MDKKDAARLLRPLRGTHVFVMMAYLMIQEPLTVAELCNCTGLSDDVLRPALKYLEGEGYLCKQVVKNGRVNWLPVGSSFLGQLFQSPRLSDSGPYDDDVDESEESKENISASSIIKRQSPRLSDSGGRQSPRLSDSGVNADQLLNLAELRKAGVIGKKARDLAQLEWVTPEYVQAQVEEAKAGVWDNVQAGIVWLIENESPVDVLSMKNKLFHVTTLDGGKRGTYRNGYAWDIDVEVAEFIGHEKGCRCSQCGWMRASGMDKDTVCPECKYHNCVCDASSEEQ